MTTEIEQALENFYRGSGEIYAFECGNPECCKNERPGHTLLWCSRCKVTPYCNKECQVLHWNNGHKEECKDKDRHNHLRSVTFVNKFADLFTDLAFACLHNERGEWIGDNKAIYVELEDLPSSFERPKLEIKVIEILPIPDSPRLRDMLRSTPQIAKLTFKTPKVSSDGDGDLEYRTESFIIEHITETIRESGPEFFSMFRHKSDPNYFKDFINQLARGDTPI